MTEVERITLADVINAVHDRWFNVDDVRFDELSRSVSIPFRRNRSSAVEGVLRITGVKSLSVIDTEKVGSYDIDMLSYSPERSELTITGGIPITLTMFVERPTVSVVSS